jgi:hypothetical protein
MADKKIVHNNAKQEKKVSSTAKFDSTKIGWVDIDDTLIDSSISSALDALPHIKYIRERNGSFYKWDIFYVMQDNPDHLGYLSYRRVDKKNISLGYLYVLDGEINYTRLKALMIEDRRQILKTAVTYAKLQVDKDHSVGIFYNELS